MKTILIGIVLSAIVIVLCLIAVTGGDSPRPSRSPTSSSGVNSGDDSALGNLK